MRPPRALTIALVLAGASAFSAATTQRTGAPLRFEVATDLKPSSGRLLVIVSRSNRPAPRLQVGDAGLDAPVMFGRDVQNFGPGSVATIDGTADAFSTPNIDALPPGDYYLQAVLESNTDIRSLNAPGNAFSDVRLAHVGPGLDRPIRLSLTQLVPQEQPPPDGDYVKYVKIQSKLLTGFHRRPIYLRAGVIVPRDYGAAGQRWPVRVHIGGYGTRYTAVQRLMAPGAAFRRMWLEKDAPQFIYIQLDGAGPYGDPYQVNSDNSGPYGDAITRELIPYIEDNFHAIGKPYARVLDGESTGGWVSLALKIFYPDFFNAVWSACPDGVDFRAFQLIDIYNDKNAYFDERGLERPSKRSLNGGIEFSIRRECQMENVLGDGGSWTLSGEQWGAWNATYGPRAANGRPAPLWDARTGVIDKSVVDHWKKYDLRLVLQQNWKVLAPKLRGKIHVSVGEADNYYLNNAVHLLDNFLKTVDPPADARIVYGPGGGHCWSDLSESDKMKEMDRAVRSDN